MSSIEKFKKKLHLLEYFRNKNMVKPIVLDTKAQIETDNILNNDNLKRG